MGNLSVTAFAGVGVNPPDMSRTSRQVDQRRETIMTIHIASAGKTLCGLRWRWGAMDVVGPDCKSCARVDASRRAKAPESKPRHYDQADLIEAAGKDGTAKVTLTLSAQDTAVAPGTTKRVFQGPATIAYLVYPDGMIKVIDDSGARLVDTPRPRPRVYRGPYTVQASRAGGGWFNELDGRTYTKLADAQQRMAEVGPLVGPSVSLRIEDFGGTVVDGPVFGTAQSALVMGVGVYPPRPPVGAKFRAVGRRKVKSTRAHRAQWQH
jgi:hypothetical protein